MNKDDFMGSVERGYAGDSIFFENYDVTTDLDRIEEYARLLASVGLNAVSINNVNVHALESRLITPEYLPKLKKLADIFERFAIKMYLSINFSSPMTLSQLDTCDPLN
ncbi:alpha-glucuronidase, partial [Vibrio sp. 10N.222.55.E8]